MEEKQFNPLLMQENYFQGYQDSIEKMKNNPLLVAFDKLCYEVFQANPLGKDFLNIVKERFFIGSFPGVAKGTPTYQIDLLYVEGFRDAYRTIMASVESHSQRIAAGG